MDEPKPITCAECGADDVEYLPHNPGCISESFPHWDDDMTGRLPEHGAVNAPTSEAMALQDYSTCHTCGERFLSRAEHDRLCAAAE